MRYSTILMVFFFLAVTVNSCKKEEKKETECSPGTKTLRQITNKKAVIKLNATIYSVFIIEEGSIDTRLVPCNLPMEFYQNDLQVTISGEVKAAPANYSGPCCTHYFNITKIVR